MSSFARSRRCSGRKHVETGRREFQKRVKYNFFVICYCSQRHAREGVLRYYGGQEGRLFTGRIPGPGHFFFQTCLASKTIKRFLKTKTRRSTDQQPRTKSALHPADTKRVKRGFCSSIGLHSISLVRASDESARTVVVESLNKKVRCFFGEQSHRISTRLDPPRSPPRRAPPRLDLRVVCPGFGFDKYQGRLSPWRTDLSASEIEGPSRSSDWSSSWERSDLSNPKPGHTTGASG